MIHHGLWVVFHGIPLPCLNKSPKKVHTDRWLFFLAYSPAHWTIMHSRNFCSAPIRPRTESHRLISSYIWVANIRQAASNTSLDPEKQTTLSRIPEESEMPKQMPSVQGPHSNFCFIYGDGSKPMIPRFCGMNIHLLAIYFGAHQATGFWPKTNIMSTPD